MSEARRIGAFRPSAARRLAMLIRSPFLGLRGRAALTLRDFIVKTHGVDADPRICEDSMFFAYACVKPGSHADANLDAWFRDFDPLQRVRSGVSEIAVDVPDGTLEARRSRVNFAHLRFMEMCFSHAGKFETSRHWVADFWWRAEPNVYPARGIQIVDFGFSCERLGYYLKPEDK